MARRATHEVFRLCVLLAAVPIIARLVSSLVVLVTMKRVNNIQRDLQSLVLRRALEAPLHSSLQVTAGDLLTYVGSDAVGVVDGVFSLFQSTVRAVYSTILGVALLWNTSPWMIAVAVAATVARLPIQRRQARVAHEGTVARQTWHSGVSSLVSQSIDGLVTLKGYGMEESRSSALAAAIGRFSREAFAFELRSQSLYLADTAVGAILPAAVFLTGGTLVSLGITSVGSTIAAIQYVGRLMESISNLTGLYARFKSLQVHSSRLAQVLGMPSEYRGGKMPGQSINRITLSNVCFRYPAGGEVLSDVNLTLEQGEIVGVSGPSGVGKTTLVRLICGLLRPSHGTIQVNEIDLSTVDMAWYRRKIAMASERDYLFDDTIRANLLLGKPYASNEEIEECLDMCMIGNVIRSLPYGVDTKVGKGGVDLSSGEKQRLFIARAILRDPDLLVLDETTSNLDLQLEQTLFASLQAWFRRRIVILISHRQNVLKWADCVYSLKDGIMLRVSSNKTVGHFFLASGEATE